MVLVSIPFDANAISHWLIPLRMGDKARGTVPHFAGGANEKSRPLQGRLFSSFL